MGYRIRQMDAERAFCEELTVEALHRVITPEAIDAALTATGTHTPRVRKLTAEVTIWVLIAMNLYTHVALRHVLCKVAQGLRFIWPDPTYRVPGPAPSSTAATNSAPRRWSLCLSGWGGRWRPRRRRARSGLDCA